MVEAFLKRTGMTPSRLGRQAVRDNRLVAQLRQGRELRTSTTVRLLKYMSDVEGPPSAKRTRRDPSKAKNAAARPCARPRQRSGTRTGAAR